MRMRSGASRSAARPGCTFSIRTIGVGAAQVYVKSHPTRIFMASNSWSECRQRHCCPAVPTHPPAHDPAKWRPIRRSRSCAFKKTSARSNAKPEPHFCLLIARGAVPLPRLVKRRDVIAWAPEKRQRRACLFRRQTRELKNTEILYGARRGDNSCYEAPASYQHLYRGRSKSASVNRFPPLTI